MNAIISNGDYTASVQLPVERKQLAGALSYLGKNHASAYDIKYNEESDQGLSFTLDCRGVVENAIAKAIPTGFRFHTFNPQYDSPKGHKIKKYISFVASMVLTARKIAVTVNSRQYQGISVP